MGFRSRGDIPLHDSALRFAVKGEGENTGLGFRVYGVGCREQGAGFRVITPAWFSVEV